MANVKVVITKLYEAKQSKKKDLAKRSDKALDRLTELVNRLIKKSVKQSQKKDTMEGDFEEYTVKEHREKKKDYSTRSMMKTMSDMVNSKNEIEEAKKKKKKAEEVMKQFDSLQMESLENLKDFDEKLLDMLHKMSSKDSHDLTVDDLNKQSHEMDKRLNVIAERLEKQKDISSENISDYSENVEKLQNVMKLCTEGIEKLSSKIMDNIQEELEIDGSKLTGCLKICIQGYQILSGFSENFFNVTFPPLYLQLAKIAGAFTSFDPQLLFPFARECLNDTRNDLFYTTLILYTTVPLAFVLVCALVNNLIKWYTLRLERQKISEMLKWDPSKFQSDPNLYSKKNGSKIGLIDEDEFINLYRFVREGKIKGLGDDGNYFCSSSTVQKKKTQFKKNFVTSLVSARSLHSGSRFESLSKDKERDKDRLTLTEEELDDLKKKFWVKCDSDSSENLTKEAFKNLVKEITQNSVEIDLPTDDDLDAAFLLVDEIEEYNPGLEDGSIIATIYGADDKLVKDGTKGIIVGIERSRKTRKGPMNTVFRVQVMEAITSSEGSRIKPVVDVRPGKLRLNHFLGMRRAWFNYLSFVQLFLSFLIFTAVSTKVCQFFGVEYIATHDFYNAEDTVPELGAIPAACAGDPLSCTAYGFDGNIPCSRACREETLICVIRSDYSTRCDTPSYEAMRLFALLMMLICKATIFIPLPSTAAVNMSLPMRFMFLCRSSWYSLNLFIDGLQI